MRFPLRLACVAVTSVCLPLSAATAQSSTACGDHASVVERLESAFGETRQSVALSPANHLVEVFASEETGTWTITVTGANGRTCLVASGHSYERVDPALPAPAGARL